MSKLTPRQLSVVICLCDGLTIDQTADKLFISRSTVEKALQGAKKRLKAKTIAHVVSTAFRKGVIYMLIIVSATTSVDVVRLRTRNGRREFEELTQPRPGIT